MADIIYWGKKTPVSWLATTPYSGPGPTLTGGGQTWTPIASSLTGGEIYQSESGEQMVVNKTPTGYVGTPTTTTSTQAEIERPMTTKEVAQRQLLGEQVIGTPTVKEKIQPATFSSVMTEKPVWIAESGKLYEEVGKDVVQPLPSYTEWKEKKLIAGWAGKPETIAIYTAWSPMERAITGFGGLITAAVSPQLLPKYIEYEKGRREEFVRGMYEAYKKDKLLQYLVLESWKPALEYGTMAFSIGKVSMVGIGAGGRIAGLVSKHPALTKVLSTTGKIGTIGLGLGIAGVSARGLPEIGIGGVSTGIQKLKEEKPWGIEEIIGGGIGIATGTMITRAGWKMLFPPKPVEIQTIEISKDVVSQEVMLDTNEVIGTATRKALVKAGKREFTTESVVDFGGKGKDVLSGYGQITTKIKEIKSPTYTERIKGLFGYTYKPAGGEIIDVSFFTGGTQQTKIGNVFYSQIVYGKGKGVFPISMGGERGVIRGGIELSLMSEKTKNIEILTKVFETTSEGIPLKAVSYVKGGKTTGFGISDVITKVSHKTVTSQIFKPSGKLVISDVTGGAVIGKGGLEIGKHTAKDIIKSIVSKVIPIKYHPTAITTGLGATAVLGKDVKVISGTSLKQEKKIIPGVSSIQMGRQKESIILAPKIGITDMLKEHEKEKIGTTPITTPIQTTIQRQGEKLKTPLITNIVTPPITPTRKIPPIIPPIILPFPSGGGGRGRQRKISFGMQKLRYQPSLGGVLLGRRAGKPPKKYFTGLEIRPVIKQKRRRRR